MTLLDMPTRKSRRPSRRARTEHPGAGAFPWERDDPLRFRLTVDQYHDMIEAGILLSGTPIELLDGQLVWKDRSAAGDDPMSVGFEYSYWIKALTALNARLPRLGCHIQIQLPITLPPNHEPEPDAAIIRGKMEDYGKGHPRAADVLCAIEVSDSSLGIDRGRKLRAYANAGIQLYVILNLPGRCAERYAEPVVGQGRYAESRTFGPKDKLTFPTGTGKGLTVAVKSLLP